MYCGKCGLKLPDEEFICPRCGADMSDRPTYRHELDKVEKPGFFRRLMDKITGK